MSALAALQLTAPMALWGLTAALPILLFHLYFRRRRRVLVPFTPLLLESFGPVRREARFKRLREAASLLARMLALACAVLALGGLRPAEARAPVRDLFVVIDADVTTAARESDGSTRLEHAQRLARAFVRAVPERTGAGRRLAGRVSVVVADAAPRLLVPPTDDLQAALRALEEELTPAPATTDLGPALELTARAAAERERARVVVLSARDVTAPELPPHVAVELHGIGTTRADQKLTSFDVRRTADGAYEVAVGVTNDDAVKQARFVTVKVDGELIASDEADLEPGVDTPVRFRVPAPRQAVWLTVELEGSDAFPANDVVEARLAPLPRPSLLVVHDGRVRPYTAAMVRALVDEKLVDEERSGFVRAANLAEARMRDVILVDGVALEPSQLRPGAYVFLAPLAGALPFELGPVVEKPLIWRTEPGHPLIRDLDFRRAFVVRARTLRGEGLEPLAYAEGRPVLGEGERGGVRYVVLGLDPEGSMLPVQAALPRLVRNAVLRLARAPVAPLQPFYRRGEALRPEVDLPGGPAVDVAWSGPTKDPLLASVAEGRAAARVAPAGAVWRVPAGAVGRATLTTGADSASPWAGRTALVDLDPDRTIAPARPEALPPPASPERADTAVRWRNGLLALAVLFLLLDLALVAHARRGR